MGLAPQSQIHNLSSLPYAVNEDIFMRPPLDTRKSGPSFKGTWYPSLKVISYKKWDTSLLAQCLSLE